MSHHDHHETAHYDEATAEANSKADVLAMLSLVAIIVVLAVFYVGQ